MKGVINLAKGWRSDPHVFRHELSGCGSQYSGVELEDIPQNVRSEFRTPGRGVGTEISKRVGVDLVSAIEYTRSQSCPRGNPK